MRLSKSSIPGLLLIALMFVLASRAGGQVGPHRTYLPHIVRPVAPTPTPTPSPTATLAVPFPTATATPGGRPACDPSYPTVCIPPPPPDLDCPDIPYRSFPVLPPDPHNFDRDGDGIGCEPPPNPE